MLLLLLTCQDGRSAASQLLQLFGVARPLHRDLRSGGIDLAEIVGRKLDGRRSDVFLEPVKLRGARDRNDPRVLGEQPGERNLRRSGVLASRNPAKQIDQCLIGFPGFRREARQRSPKVGAVEFRVLVYFPREETLAERAVGNETDSELFDGWQHLLLGSSGPQRVLTLERRDRLHGMCAADCLHARFRKAEMPDLAFLDQALHRSGDIFDGHDGIDAVLIEQIDGVDFEPLERAFGDLPA
jgi:hypothetical protein